MLTAALGACARTSSLRWIRVYLIVQFAQSFFICCCCMSMHLCQRPMFDRFLSVLFSVWKSRKSPRTRGRLSLNHFDACVVEEKHISVQETPACPCTSETKQNGLWGLTTLCGTAPQNPSHGSIICPLRQPTVRIAENSSPARPEPGRDSPTPSTISRIFPRIDLFSNVMKDEVSAQVV